MTDSSDKSDKSGWTGKAALAGAAIGLVCPAEQLPMLTRYLPTLRGIARRIESSFQHRREQLQAPPG